MGLAMSALSPIIRGMRALADQYHQISDDLLAKAREMANGQVRDHTVDLSAMMKSHAFVHDHAADQLQAEDDALKPPREGMDQPIEYNPRGKAPPHSSER
jgi:hypothetical protein